MNRCPLLLRFGGPHTAAPVVNWIMDRRMIEAHLALTERHVAEGKRHVARQRELVAELERDGHDTATALDLLRQFEELQALHVADRNRHVRALGLPPKEN